MEGLNLTGAETIALCSVMALLTAAIAWCIKWGVETLAHELRTLSESIGSLRNELHKLAMRVLSLEEWRKSFGRRHDDGPPPVRFSQHSD